MSAIRAFFGSEVDQFSIAFDRIAKYLPSDVVPIVLSYGAPKELEINQVVQKILDQANWNNSNISKSNTKFLRRFGHIVSTLCIPFISENILREIMGRFCLKPQKISCFGFATLPNSLSKLCLTEGYFSEDLISRIMSLCPSLDFLEIQTAVITDQILGKFQRLRRLSLTVYDLRFTGKYLSECYRLTHLSLKRRMNGQNLEEDTHLFPIEEILACIKLENLTLEGFYLNQDQIRSLRELPDLRYVAIADYIGGDSAMATATVSLPQKIDRNYRSYFIFGED